MSNALGFICTDDEFSTAIDQSNTDSMRASLLVSELYGKAVQTVYGGPVIEASDAPPVDITVSAAYLGYLHIFFRDALENDGIGRKLYDSLESICPYCFTVQVACLGMKLDQEVTSMIETSVNMTASLNRGMATDAIVYVARHSSVVLVTAQLEDVPIVCLRDSPSCGKSVLELLEVQD